MSMQQPTKTNYMAQIQECKAQNIIFDLGGVLFTPTIDFTETRCGEKFNYILNLCLFLNTYGEPQEDKRFNYKGLVLPTLICNTWVNTMTNHEALTESITLINKHVEDEQQKTKLLLAAQTVFSPERCVTDSLRQIPHGIELLKACAEKGYTIYLFTNLNREILEEIKKQHSDILSLFTGLVSSGDLRLMKPLKESFEAMLKTFNLKAHECFFIDDQQENIDNAALCDINGALFTK